MTWQAGSVEILDSDETSLNAGEQVVEPGDRLVSGWTSFGPGGWMGSEPVAEGAQQTAGVRAVPGQHESGAPAGTAALARDEQAALGPVGDRDGCGVKDRFDVTVEGHDGDCSADCPAWADFLTWLASELSDDARLEFTQRVAHLLHGQKAPTGGAWLIPQAEVDRLLSEMQERAA